MKKFFLVMLVALMGLGASAQQGKLGIGADFGIAPMLEDIGGTNFEIGAKVRYGLSDNVRLEGNIDYAFKASSIDLLDITANIHYVVPVSSKVGVYPLAGIGYGRATISGSSNVGGTKFTISQGYNRFLFNIGAGFDFKVNDGVALNFELKYQYFKDFSRLPIKVGIVFDI